jgi:hypothetical protein
MDPKHEPNEVALAATGEFSHPAGASPGGQPASAEREDSPDKPDDPREDRPLSEGSSSLGDHAREIQLEYEGQQEQGKV